MAIYTGLLERIEPTDDELATLIGHEITHALREHSRERVSERLGTNLLIDIAISTLGIDERQAILVELITELTFTLPNSRLHEREADCIGVELAARAGFNPLGAVTLWQKMARQNTGNSPEFLSTHPSPANRIRDLWQYAQRVDPLYQSSRRRLAQTRTAPAQPRPSPRTGTCSEPSTLSTVHASPWLAAH
jgi:predicted Zn-dependent protease